MNFAPWALTAWLFVYQVAGAAPPASTTPAARVTATPSTGFPLCHRPLDFTLSKEVTAYESCFAARAFFCEGHEKQKECILLRKALSLVKADKKTKDPNPDERCLVRQDGSYACHQEPIRFLSLEPQSVAPEPPTSVAPISPGLGMPDMKMPGGRKGGITPPAPSAAPGAPQPTVAPTTGADDPGAGTDPVPPLDILGPRPGK